MKNLLPILFLLIAGCGGTAGEAVSHFYGTGTEVSWATGGDWASCGSTIFPAPDNTDPVKCHWACGSYEGSYQSVWVTFEVDFIEGQGYYTGNVKVETNSVCFIEDPS